MKKIGFVTAGVFAGMAMLSGFASADDVHVGSQWPGEEGEGNSSETVGLINVENVDALHNVNLNVGICENNINILGVQVPIQDTLNGIGIPILSPGQNEAEGATPENCALASSEDGGTVQNDN
jgi:hypothetical protein